MLRDHDLLNLTVKGVERELAAVRLDGVELWALDGEGRPEELLAFAAELAEVSLQGDVNWAPAVKVVKDGHPCGYLVQLIRSRAWFVVDEDEITFRSNGSSSAVSWLGFADRHWSSRFGVGPLVIAPACFFAAWERDFATPRQRSRLSPLGA